MLGQVNYALVPVLVAMSARHGVNLDVVCTELGFKSVDLDRIIVQTSMQGVDELLNKIECHVSSPCFFLELGSQVTYESLGALGQAVATAPTFREALVVFSELGELVYPLAKFKFSKSEEELTQIIYGADERYPFSLDKKYQEMMMAALVKMLKSLRGVKADVLSVSFTYAQPSYLDGYEKAFEDIDLKFDQNACCLTVVTESLNRLAPGHSEQFHKAFVERARLQQAKLPSTHSISQRVTQIIESKIGYQLFNIEDISSELNMTNRTLQRRLKDEGYSYAQLRDTVRFSYAEEHLRASNMSMSELAASLGFSEPANFYSAFKRWSGVSPREYRKRHT